MRRVGKGQTEPVQFKRKVQPELWASIPIRDIEAIKASWMEKRIINDGTCTDPCQKDSNPDNSEKAVWVLYTLLLSASFNTIYMIRSDKPIQKYLMKQNHLFFFC